MLAAMKTLLIDNYDSFTYNLFQLLAEANGEEPIVVRNDDGDLGGAARCDFDNIVISPGPGQPRPRRRLRRLRRRDRARARCRCSASASATRASAGSHGGAGRARARGDARAAQRGLPRRLAAVRRHPAGVPGGPLPLALRRAAAAGRARGDRLDQRRRRDGASRTATRPLWGVQFHPESICTEHGRRLLANFRDLTARAPAAASATAAVARARRRRRAAGRSGAAAARRGSSCRSSGWTACTTPSAPSSTSTATSANAFWLDSSKVDERARFSFMGAAGGPLGAVDHLRRRRRRACASTRGGETEVPRESIFDYLGREMRRLRYLSDDLPFDFNCGFVGYFGYELKADCGGSDAHRSPMPDAAFIFADRLIAFDHVEQRTYVLCVAEPRRRREAERWIARDEPAARRRCRRSRAGAGATPRRAASPVEFRLSRSHEQYLDDIAALQAAS